MPFPTKRVTTEVIHRTGDGWDVVDVSTFRDPSGGLYRRTRPREVPDVILVSKYGRIKLRSIKRRKNPEKGPRR